MSPAQPSPAPSGLPGQDLPHREGALASAVPSLSRDFSFPTTEPRYLMDGLLSLLTPQLPSSWDRVRLFPPASSFFPFPSWSAKASGTRSTWTDRVCRMEWGGGGSSGKRRNCPGFLFAPFKIPRLANLSSTYLHGPRHGAHTAAVLVCLCSPARSLAHGASSRLPGRPAVRTPASPCTSSA